MSGHSKWNNIKRKKEKADGAKAKVFTKYAKEIAVAVKEGGSTNPDTNARLRDAISKAKAEKVLIPLNKCDVLIAGIQNRSTGELLQDAISMINDIIK